MGFFGFFSSQSPQEKAAEEVRSGARTPSRKERELCWAARDVYFSCLDAQGVIDAVNEPGKSTAAAKCKAEEEGFERDCARAWVTYFKQWRVADHKKRETLEKLKAEGANVIPLQRSSDVPAAPTKRQ